MVNSFELSFIITNTYLLSHRKGNKVISLVKESASYCRDLIVLLGSSSRSRRRMQDSGPRLLNWRLKTTEKEKKHTQLSQTHAHTHALACNPRTSGTVNRTTIKYKETNIEHRLHSYKTCELQIKKTLNTD